MKLRWLPAALEDRVAIYDYLDQESPAAAILVDDRIWKAIQRLVRYPELGRKGRHEGTRELVVQRTPYIVAYVVKDDTVEVRRIIHASRRWPNLKTQQAK